MQKYGEFSKEKGGFIPTIPLSPNYAASRLCTNQAEFTWNEFGTCCLIPGKA